MSDGVVVVGAGLTGLIAAWRRQQQDPARELRVLDRAPEPGGQTRTLRSEGYSCELGPQMFRDGPRLRALLAELGLERNVVPARAALKFTPPAPDVVRFLIRSFEDDGDEPPPSEAAVLTLRTGTGDLVQALRRRLGAAVWLGRAARSVARRDDGTWQVALGGGTTLSCSELVLATPPNAAAELLHPLSSEFADDLFGLTSLSVTNVFLGFDDDPGGTALSGAGFVVHDQRDNPFLAALFVTNLFPDRTASGRSLVRIVLDGELLPRDRDPTGISHAAEQALRGYTDLGARLAFWRVVHNHDVIPRTNPANRAHRARIAAHLRAWPRLTWLGT